MRAGAILSRFSVVNLLKWLDDNPVAFKTLVSIYPPFLCAGVKVKEISKDFRYIRVEMGLKWYNKNYVGTQFGGSLYAMTDPFLMIMLMKNLGKDYIVWDKAAEIEFIRPGTTTVTAEFKLTEEDLQKIKEEVKRRGKFLPEFDVFVKDLNDEIVAKVKKIIYVRKKK